jgi:hypothetical protein
MPNMAEISPKEDFISEYCIFDFLVGRLRSLSIFKSL